MSPNPDFLAAVQAAFPEKDTPFVVVRTRHKVLGFGGLGFRF
jgi:hypothetical protein